MVDTKHFMVSDENFIDTLLVLGLLRRSSYYNLIEFDDLVILRMVNHVCILEHLKNWPDAYVMLTDSHNYA